MRTTSTHKAEEQSQPSCLGAVMRCGLSEAELTERELLLELQHNSQRWFSQQEFDRLKELSKKNVCECRVAPYRITPEQLCVRAAF